MHRESMRSSLGEKGGAANNLAQQFAVDVPEVPVRYRAVRAADMRLLKASPVRANRTRPGTYPARLRTRTRCSRPTPASQTPRHLPCAQSGAGQTDARVPAAGDSGSSSGARRPAARWHADVLAASAGRSYLPSLAHDACERRQAPPSRGSLAGQCPQMRAPLQLAQYGRGCPVTWLRLTAKLTTPPHQPQIATPCAIAH